MRGVIFLALLIVNAYAQTNTINPAQCGRRIGDIRPGKREEPPKVVGGVRADTEDWGWQILLNYNGRFICGGSLVNQQWVVTAAHCTEGSAASTFSVTLGLHDRNAPEKWVVTRTVSRKIEHPSYNSRLFTNDIALLKLSSTVDYTDQIVPVCIPAATDNHNGLSSSYATGWGTTSSAGTISRYLLEVQMPVLTETECRNKYGTNSVQVSVSICAGKAGAGLDTCQGDSGGPLVVNQNGKWVLAGITSWGYGCGDGGVYTKVPAFTSWITSSIAAN